MGSLWNRLQKNPMEFYSQKTLRGKSTTICLGQFRFSFKSVPQLFFEERVHWPIVLRECFIPSYPSTSRVSWIMSSHYSFLPRISESHLIWKYGASRCKYLRWVIPDRVGPKFNDWYSYKKRRWHIETHTGKKPT